MMKKNLLKTLNFHKHTISTYEVGIEKCEWDCATRNTACSGKTNTIGHISSVKMTDTQKT